MIPAIALSVMVVKSILVAIMLDTSQQRGCLTRPPTGVTPAHVRSNRLLIFFPTFDMINEASAWLWASFQTLASFCLDLSRGQYTVHHSKS